MTNKAGDGESTPLLASKGVLPPSSLTSSVRSCSNSSTHTPTQRRESGSMRLLETKAPSLVVGDWLSLSNRNQNATTESGDGDAAVLCPGSPVAPPRGTTVGGDTNAQQPLNPLTRLGYAFGHAQSTFVFVDYVLSATISFVSSFFSLNFLCSSRFLLVVFLPILYFNYPTHTTQYSFLFIHT